MSLTYSLSTSSASSSATMSTMQPNEQQIDPSNILYNDRQNYQIIFTNDSRFFDTSLHLFKSYRDLNYIKLDKKKSKKNFFSSSTNTLKTISNGSNTPFRPKSTGFSNDYDVDRKPNGTLKPSFSRDYDHSISQRSDPGATKFLTPQIRRAKSPLVTADQRQSFPYNHSNRNDNSSDDDNDDDADVIVTRL